MSYAIANVIYGVPLTKEIHLALADADEDFETAGFTPYYSGGGSYAPGFCGVELGDFDECGGHILFSSLKYAPTPEQKAEAETRLAELPEYIRKVCLPVDTYIVWSSS